MQNNLLVDDYQEVLDAIENHDNKDYSGDFEVNDLLKILSGADDLDALGFTGIFGLFDISLSSAFIKFISEHYNKKDFEELNKTINTGLFFYIFFHPIP